MRSFRAELGLYIHLCWVVESHRPHLSPWVREVASLPSATTAMRVLSYLSVILPLFAHAAYAANAFAGSNLYYAAGLSQDQRTTLLK